MAVTEVVDEAFLRRYQELLDAEDAAFDELEHAVEEGDRELYEQNLAAWLDIEKKRRAFLHRHGLLSPLAPAGVS